MISEDSARLLSEEAFPEAAQGSHTATGCVQGIPGAQEDQEAAGQCSADPVPLPSLEEAEPRSLRLSPDPPSH